MKIGLKPQEVVNHLIDLYLSVPSDIRENVMLIGPPGIGKSASVRDAAEKIAEKLGREFIEVNDINIEELFDMVRKNPDKYFLFKSTSLHTVEPIDLRGIPRSQKVNGGIYVFNRPFAWQILFSIAPGILLLEDAPDVARGEILSALYRIVWDRMLADYPLHPDVLIVLTGNPSESSSVANELPAPLVNKLIYIEVKPPTVDEWYKYMVEKYGDKWSISTYTFLKAHEADHKLFFNVPGETANAAFPTPRSWTMLALHEYALDSKVYPVGFVGEEAGVKYQAFKQVNIDIHALLNNPELWKSYKLEERFMALQMLANYVAKKEGKASKDKIYRLLITILDSGEEYYIIFYKILYGLSKSLSSGFSSEFIDYVAKVYPEQIEKLDRVITTAMKIKYLKT